MHKEAKYDKKTGRATYSHNIHYGEVIREAQIPDNGSGESKQDLGNKRGTDMARETLAYIHANCKK